MDENNEVMMVAQTTPITTPIATDATVSEPVVKAEEVKADGGATANKEKNKNGVIDSVLGVDYSYILNKQKSDTLVVTKADLENEPDELIRTFLEVNNDVKCYIGKTSYDPMGFIAKHILTLCKDKDYKVKVGDKEYRLVEAILIRAMSECYNYVNTVAKALAEKSGNKSCIGLEDEDVYAIAENWFKLGAKVPTIKIDSGAKTTTSATKSTKSKKSSTKTSTPKAVSTSSTVDKSEEEALDLPYEIKDDIAEVNKSDAVVQIDLFDLLG